MAAARSETRVTIGTVNGKRHWPDPGGRAVKIVNKLLDERVTVFGANEFNARMANAVEAMPNITVHRGSSNEPARPEWTGNLVAWNHLVWEELASNELSLTIRYWPGLKKNGPFRRGWKRMTLNLPWVRLRNQLTGQVIVVLVIHLPTKFNARAFTRLRLMMTIRSWLRRRIVPAFVVGDPNQGDMFNFMPKALIIARHGPDLVVGRRKYMRTLVPNILIKLRGLSDHHAIAGTVSVWNGKPKKRR